MRTTQYRRLKYPLPPRCRHHETIKDAALWTAIQFNKDILSGNAASDDIDIDTERCTKNIAIQPILSSSTPQIITTTTTASFTQTREHNRLKNVRKKNNVMTTDISEEREDSSIRREHQETPDAAIKAVSNFWKDDVYYTIVDHLKRSVQLQRNLVQKHVHLKNKYYEYRNQGISEKEEGDEVQYPDPPVVEMELRLGRLIPNSESKQQQHQRELPAEKDNSLQQQRTPKHHQNIQRRSLSTETNNDQMTLITPAVVDSNSYTFRGGFDIMGRCDDFFTVPTAAIDALHAPLSEISSDEKATKKKRKSLAKSNMTSTDEKTDRSHLLPTSVHSSDTLNNADNNNRLEYSWTHRFHELRMNQRMFLWKHRCTLAAYNPALRELKSDEPIYYLLRERANNFYLWWSTYLDYALWRKLGNKARHIMMIRNKPRTLIYEECLENSPARYFGPTRAKKSVTVSHDVSNHPTTVTPSDKPTSITIPDKDKVLNDFIQEMRSRHGLETHHDNNNNTENITSDQIDEERKPTASLAPFLYFADGTEVCPQVGQLSQVQDRTITAAIRRESISKIEIDDNDNIDSEVVASLVVDAYNRQKLFSSLMTESIVMDSPTSKSSFLTPVSKLHLSETCILKVVKDMFFPNSDESLWPDEFVTSLEKLKNKHCSTDSGDDQLIQPPPSWERKGTLRYPVTNNTHSTTLNGKHSHIEVPLIYDINKATTFEMHAFTSDGYRIEFTQGIPTKAFHNCVIEMEGVMKKTNNIHNSTLLQSAVLVSPLVCLSSEKTNSDFHSIADQPRLKWSPITGNVMLMNQCNSNNFHGDFHLMNARRTSIVEQMSKLTLGSSSKHKSAITELWEAAKEKAKSGLESDCGTTQLPMKRFGFGLVSDGPRPMSDAPFTMSENKETLSHNKNDTHGKSSKQINYPTEETSTHKNNTQESLYPQTVSISNMPMSDATTPNSLYYTPDIYCDTNTAQEMSFTNIVVRSKSKVSQVDLAMPTWCGDVRLSVAVERSSDKENGTPYPQANSILIGSRLSKMISDGLIDSEVMSLLGDLSYDSLEDKYNRSITLVRIRKRMHYRFLRAVAVRPATEDLQQLLIPKTDRFKENSRACKKLKKNPENDSVDDCKDLHLVNYLLNSPTYGSAWSANNSSDIMYESVVNYFKPYLTTTDLSVNSTRDNNRVLHSPTLGEYIMTCDIISDNFLKLCITDVFTDEVPRTIARHKHAVVVSQIRNSKSEIRKASTVANTQQSDEDNNNNDESGSHVTDGSDTDTIGLDNDNNDKPFTPTIQRLSCFNEVKKGCVKGVGVMRISNVFRKTREVEVEVDIPRLTMMLDTVELALDNELEKLFQIKEEKKGNKICSDLGVFWSRDQMESVGRVLKDRHTLMVDKLMDLVVKSMLDSLASISKLP